MTELPLFAHARRSDPQTSWDAARSVRGVEALQRRILGLYEAYGPMTDPDICLTYTRLGYPVATPQNIRSRRAELVQMGKVRDTGLRVVGPSGRKFVVWGLTNKEG